ncbi:YceI family protein [Seonamhaeicola sp. ML3]|uniref:YceI family protein n=1 Tax=Seonamhaeicola sp. ML3 TaxID=2937786 RepID=UPI00200D5F0B|nr:YceI family protein [Seonamhaeicola sp. ML3]
MKTNKFFKKLFLCFVVLGFSVNHIQSQIFKLDNSASHLTVFGTSNLHGWKVSAETQQGSISFNDLFTCEIDHLTLAVLTKSLKGVKPGITETVAKTLNADKYRYILFELSKVKQVQEISPGVFKVEVLGNLIISGFKKTVQLDLDLVKNENTVQLRGETKLKMTDFNITPPKALLGKLKVKDDLMIRFETKFITEESL